MTSWRGEKCNALLPDPTACNVHYTPKYKNLDGNKDILEIILTASTLELKM